MTKRIMETLLCLVFLIVVVRYGLEQNRVIQREKEVMVLQEKNIGEDVLNPEQAIEKKAISEDKPIKKVQTMEEEDATKEPLADKAQKAEMKPVEETDLADTEVDWTQVSIFDEPIVLYAQGFVNVRKGPDTSYEILGKLSTNDPVDVLGEYSEDNWMAVIYQGEKAFVSGRYLGEEQIDLAALQADQEAAAMAAVANAASEEPALPYIASPAGVVFVVDSRCVQMSAAVGGGGSTWICENSKRYSWFETNAVPRLDDIVGKGTKVVICMGVNDPGNYKQYAALTNQRAAQWAARGATTYFVSVNPVWENPYVTQEQVDTFNANMPGLLNGVRWIDTASIIKQGGYKLVDGLHYDTNSYISIFNLICGSL